MQWICGYLFLFLFLPLPNIMFMIPTKPIKEQLSKFKKEGKSMFVSSSFQTNSIVLLHIISEFDSSIPVYFINTGYHFPETIVHKNKVASVLGLKVIDLVSRVPKNLQRDEQGNLLFTFDPDYCCFLNKVQPIESLLDKYDIWINGIRSDQSHDRNNLAVLHPTQGKAVRYHPLLNWSYDDLEKYIKKHKLPEHPLEARGYKSIGCEPCTRPAKDGGRDGRWYGMKKNECGLNTALVKNRSKSNPGI